MGYFSWMFANEANGRALHVDRPGYLALPNGQFLHEPFYDGYGHFGDKDVYDLVTDWNREYLSQHPEFIIAQHGRVKDEKTGFWRDHPGIPVGQFPWYPAYADLSKDRDAVVAAAKEAYREQGKPHEAFEYRWIGIEIACYDNQNSALPFPIKVCSTTDVPYDRLPASENDPDQGCDPDYTEDED